jgi:hypothetical protein
MRRFLASLLLLLPLLSCAETDDRTYAQLDTRLRGMAGGSERQLLAAMGRIPDRSYTTADQVKVLQWRWDAAYDSPACTPRRAMMRGGYGPDVAHEDCVVEWTVSQGTSQRYTWQGRGCASATIVSFPVQ